MKIGNLAGRLVLVNDEGAIDVEKASAGQFTSDVQEAYERWPEFMEWAKTATGEAIPFKFEELGPVSPRPVQIFAIGANYKSHADEGGMSVPNESPMIFTKWVSSFIGPIGEIELPSDAVDWELELVFVIGKMARHVPAERGWDYVAGVTVGQDLSEREMQMRGETPQMGISKSLPGFSPTGPFLVTPDSLPNPDALEMSSTLNGEPLQRASTADLVYSVPALVAELSASVPLYPGDVVFTGTPAGVGLVGESPQLLKDGDVLVSRIEGIGEMRHTFRNAANFNPDALKLAMRKLAALQAGWPHYRASLESGA